MEAEHQSSNPASFSLVDLLNIDLVKDKIFSFFNLRDLKLLSEVSKGSLKAVRNSKEYSNKATLMIGMYGYWNQLIRNVDFVKVICSESGLWEGKKLQVDAAIPLDYLQGLGLETLVKKMESITFYLSKRDSYFGVADVLAHVLEKAESVKHLRLEPFLLTKGVQGAISKEGVSSNLKNLTTFEIKSSHKPPATAMVKADVELSRIYGALKEFSLVLGNLKKLSFGMFDCKNVRPPTSDYFKGILWIIENNKGTLEDLELHGDIWMLKEIGNIHLPKLKRLILSTSKAGGKIAEMFLANQGQLEHLNVSISEEFPLGVIKVIGEKQSKLKYLRIKATTFTLGGRMNWGFLTNFTELKSIFIIKPARSNALNDTLYGYCKDILCYIPATVETFGLCGINDEYPDWNRRGWAGWGEVYERNIWKRLSRLENLTEVYLDGSLDVLNNQGLQDLIKHCPQLTALSFSYGDGMNVTNFGVTGVDSWGCPEETFSLDQLKGLKYLSIRYCPGINLGVLISVVKFKFLRRFRYESRWGGTSVPGISKLLSQNPSLEEISLRIWGWDEASYNEVKEIIKSRRFISYKVLKK